MAFNIGDRVRVRDWRVVTSEQGSTERWKGGKAQNCGKEGNIIDKLSSEKRGCTIYKVHFDDTGIPSSVDYTENELERVVSSTKENGITASLSINFELANNVVITEITEHGEIIARGHGHIIHDGTIGVVQAASYALKKAYVKLNGGELLLEKEGRF